MKTISISLAALATTAALAGTAALAQNGGAQRAPQIRADADGDGTVSRAEFTAGALARFDAADSDKDGTLTAQERRTARPERRGMGRSPMPAQAPAPR